MILGSDSVTCTKCNWYPAYMCLPETILETLFCLKQPYETFVYELYLQDAYE